MIELPHGQGFMLPGDERDEPAEADRDLSPGRGGFGDPPAE